MKPSITRTRRHHRGRLVASALFAAFACAAVAQAQLDPLLSLKRVPPRIIVVFDTSFRMMEDGFGNYYDPVTYNVADDGAAAAALGLPSGNAHYRRIYMNLRMDPTQDPTHKYLADTIAVHGNATSFMYNSFWDNTRMEIAKAGVALGVSRNSNPRFLWGLIRLRQNSPTWKTAPSNACDKPVLLSSGPDGRDQTPCNGGGQGSWVIYAPQVASANAAVMTSGQIVAPAASTGATIAGYVATALPAFNPYLIPAGRDTSTTEDRPLALALDDAKAAITTAMGADTLAAARNTVVVLVTGGRDYAGDPAAKALEFGSGLGAARKRVPIFVVAVRPKVDDEAQLQSIATNSGGFYVKAMNAQMVSNAVNLAVQAGVQRPADLSTRTASEYSLVSPVIGTVNLENARDASGSSLPNTLIDTPTGAAIPQRNNLMLTAGFALGPAALSAQWSPGFEGRLRAFRVFKPVVDGTKPSGYTFTKDGTALWPDLDGRPELAGLARIPADASRRNIYTYIPGTGMVEFTSANLAVLQPHLNATYPSRVILMVRSLPIGAVISSTPAIMDAPSLDPPPDDDYGRADAAGTYAGDHKDRRSIIFFGANDGMVHAVDARTGIEVWAFIPYNLLPKLQSLIEGQAPDQFTYFVDQSPKIAEVKIGGAWRSLLIIGQGWGGTFYQAFDVTEAGMGGPSPASDDWGGALSSFASPNRITFKWSFPDYAQFDPVNGQPNKPVVVTTADGTPGSRLRFYGDLKASASVAEKKVGFTWSDPAVGALNADRSVNAAIVGSGYFPLEAESTAALPARLNAGVGRAFYLINAETGKLVGNAGGGCSTGTTGTGCLDVGETGGQTPKNALQADPTVTSDYGSYLAKKAYLGDLDGEYYRFDFTSGGAITKRTLKSTGQPIYASSALMWVGSTQQYIFFTSGSDMLPSAPPNTYGTGTFQMYGLLDSNNVVSDAFSPVSLAATSNTADNPAVKDANNNTLGFPAGERPSTSPSVAGEIVFFTTTTESATASAEPTYSFYALQYKGGNAYVPAGSTGTGGGGGKKSGGGAAVTAIKTGTGRATAPFVVDQHLYFATSSNTGANVEAFGDPNDFNNGVGQVGVRILSWREIRR